MFATGGAGRQDAGGLAASPKWSELTSNVTRLMDEFGGADVPRATSAPPHLAMQLSQEQLTAQLAAGAVGTSQPEGGRWTPADGYSGDIRYDEDYEAFYRSQLSTGAVPPNKLPPPLTSRTVYSERLPLHLQQELTQEQQLLAARMTPGMSPAAELLMQQQQQQQQQQQNGPGQPGTANGFSAGDLETALSQLSVGDVRGVSPAPSQQAAHQQLAALRMAQGSRAEQHQQQAQAQQQAQLMALVAGLQGVSSSSSPPAPPLAPSPLTLQAPTPPLPVGTPQPLPVGTPQQHASHAAQALAANAAALAAVTGGGGAGPGPLPTNGGGFMNSMDYQVAYQAAFQAALALQRLNPPQPAPNPAPQPPSPAPKPSSPSPAAPGSHLSPSLLQTAYQAAYHAALQHQPMPGPLLLPHQLPGHSFAALQHAQLAFPHGGHPGAYAAAQLAAQMSLAQPGFPYPNHVNAAAAAAAHAAVQNLIALGAGSHGGPPGGYDRGDYGEGRRGGHANHGKERRRNGHRRDEQRDRDYDADSDAHFSSRFQTLEEVLGQVASVARDQNGCRFLQRKFDEGGSPAVELVFPEVLEHLIELMVDPFGNYLVQKLLDRCSEDQRLQVLRKAAEGNELSQVALNTHGTRAIQKLIETLTTREQVQIVINALRPGVVALIRDLNGNHVVQRCLQRLGPEDSQFVYDAAAAHTMDIARHRHGCCVLQRCLDFATPAQKRRLVDTIAQHALPLAEDPFGNYVVQYVLELGQPEATAAIMQQLQGHYPQLSQQKFSSNVVEKCLKLGGSGLADLREVIIREILVSPLLPRLLQDPYANYVLQSALSVSTGQLHVALVDAIRPYLATLRGTPHGKRILSKVNVKL